VAVVVAATIAAAVPASAGADTYSVYSCRTPAGTVAARDGWVPFQLAGSSTATDTCSGNGALTGNMAPSSPGASASWSVAAPTALPITGYVLYRWAQVTNVTPDSSGNPYAYTYQLLEDGVAVETLNPGYLAQGDLGSPAAPLSEANVVVRPGIRISSLAAQVQCASGVSCQAQSGRYGAFFQLYRIALQIPRRCPTARTASASWSPTPPRPTRSRSGRCRSARATSSAARSTGPTRATTPS
jgi:hypothetical protein